MAIAAQAFSPKEFKVAIVSDATDAGATAIRDAGAAVVSAIQQIKIPTPTWVELYGELSSYVEEYGSIDCRFDDDGNRLEEYEGEYESIVDDVENIMSRYFVKSE